MRPRTRKPQASPEQRAKAGIERAAENAAAAEPWELWSLFGVVLFYGIMAIGIGPVGLTVTNSVGPLLLAGVLAAGAYVRARRDATIIWTPLFAVRCASIVYYGFGELVPLIANEQTSRVMRAYFRYQAEDIAKLNLLIAAGLLTMFASATLMSRMGWTRGILAPFTRVHEKPDPDRILGVALIFLAVGGIVRYGLALPFAWGLSDFVIPGALASLTLAYTIGIYLFTAWCLDRARHLLPAAFALVIIEFAVGLLSFNKTDMLFTTVIFLLAWVRHRVSPARILVIAGVIIALFTLAAPWVAAGRDELVQRTGTSAQGSLTARIDSLFAADRAVRVEQQGLQTGLIRFSYVNQGSFAISQFDKGAPGRTYNDALISLIPRALFPNKPVRVVGREFNYLATGNARSQSTPGWFGEAYWNFGWIGLLLVLAPIGAALGLWSYYNYHQVRAGAWYFFPVVLYGLRVGTRVDGTGVVDVFTPVGIAIVMHAILSVVGQLRLAPGRPMRLKANA